MRLTAIHNGLKWTISASGGLGLLQMVLELVIGRVLVRMLASKGVDCEIPHWLERGTKHSLLMCGNLSLEDVF